MHKKALSLFLLIFLVANAGLESADVPRLASHVPENGMATVFVTDMTSLERGRAWMSSLSEVFPGEVAITLLDIPEPRKIPPFIALANVDLEKFGWFVETRLKPILDRNLGKVRFTSTGGITEIVANGSPLAYYAVKGELFAFSLERKVVTDFVASPMRVEESLAHSPSFAKVLRRIGPSGRFVFFLNYQGVLDRVSKKIPMPDEARAILKSTGLLDIEAYGGSEQTINGAHVGMLSMVTSGRPRGFLALAVGSSAPPTSARYVPGDFSLYGRLQFTSLLEAWRQIRQAVQQMPGEGAEEGIVEFLDGFREATGLDFESDLLGSLGGEITLAAAVPEKLRFPDAVLLLEVKDRQKIERIIPKLMPGEARATEASESVKIRTGQLGPLTAAYAFKDKYLIVGTGASVVESAIRAVDGQGSLMENSKFKNALRHLGKDNHLFYLDVGSALPVYLSVLSRTLPGSRDRGFDEPPRWEAIGKLLISPFLTDLVLALAVYGDEESINLRGYSTFIGTHKLVATSSVLAGMMMPALLSAREEAQRVACLNNLKQLAVAEMMYAADHEGKFSEKLSDLYPDYIPNLEVFTCPAEQGVTITRKDDIDSLSSYVLRKGMTPASPASEALIYEEPGHHRRIGGNAAFVDGHVESLPLSEFERIVKKGRSQ